jgi:hypothetical protein
MFGEQDVVNMPGADITMPDGSACEADAIALIRGDVWLGEVKPRAAAFTSDQMVRDIQVAEAVGANTYLIACLNGVDEERVQAALTLATAKEIRLAVLDAADGKIRILSKHDLRPVAEDQPQSAVDGSNSPM